MSVWIFLRPHIPGDSAPHSSQRDLSEQYKANHITSLPKPSRALVTLTVKTALCVPWHTRYLPSYLSNIIAAPPPTPVYPHRLLYRPSNLPGTSPPWRWRTLPWPSPVAPPDLGRLPRSPTGSTFLPPVILDPFTQLRFPTQDLGLPETWLPIFWFVISLTRISTTNRGLLLSPHL